MARQRALLTYDIADDRRRLRVWKLLRGYGVAVQESVFLLDLTAPRWSALEVAVRRIADPAADDIRIWPLCERCRRAARVWCAAGGPRDIPGPVIVV
jgi:CRISPR-associated protein Cas2